MLKVKGKIVTEEDKKWLDYGRESIQKDSKASEDAAKTLITLETTLLTIYVAVLAFLKFNLVTLSPLAEFALIIFLIYWVISIIYNVSVFVPIPQSVNLKSVPAIKQATAELSQKKYRRVTIGAISFGIVLFIAFVSLFLIAMQPEEKVQIVISKGDIK